jgi:predicted  nucleic acid-binding Zn-ribbon protein
MDRKSYENVLSDLEADITIKRAEAEKKRAEAEKLDKEVLQGENVISVLRTKLSQEELVAPPINYVESVKQANNSFTLLAGDEYTEKNQSKISLNNACEKILQTEEKPLHITDLIEKLKEYGRFTNRKQLSGTIRKDHKNRFVNLGGNVWDLRYRHPEKVNN